MEIPLWFYTQPIGKHCYTTFDLLKNFYTVPSYTERTRMQPCLTYLLSCPWGGGDP